MYKLVMHETLCTVSYKKCGFKGANSCNMMCICLLIVDKVIPIILLSTKIYTN